MPAVPLPRHLDCILKTCSDMGKKIRDPIKKLLMQVRRKTKEKVRKIVSTADCPSKQFSYAEIKRWINNRKKITINDEGNTESDYIIRGKLA